MLRPHRSSSSLLLFVLFFILAGSVPAMAPGALLSFFPNAATSNYSFYEGVHGVAVDATGNIYAGIRF
jgi:hypothetical protein